tara:strand:+ start:4522 stop:4845 length:324 start_codon:yes stop_codon:yes gene_type:complete
MTFKIKNLEIESITHTKGYKKRYIIKRGIEKYDNIKFGLTRNKLFGMNSAVINTMKVELIVKNKRTKKSFLIISGRRSKITGSSNSAIKMPYKTKAKLLPNSMVAIK